MSQAAALPVRGETAVAKRRTFAIISHPDAGKTTLTEKLLLNGGAIHLAGDVKARGERRRARSDWMEIERKRGISVTTSVMTFEAGEHVFNLLDTPGHEDFSEDTYRTLTAVDSAVMVIDAAKGIEPQTRKLFEVCRLRDVPIVTFINKMDREARESLEMLDEIAETLALDVTPLLWPIGMGRNFRGCYDLVNDRLMVFAEADRKRFGAVIACEGPDDDRIGQVLDTEEHAKLVEDIEFVRGVCPPFDLEAYRGGHLTPVLFGSALRDFAVTELLATVGAYAPPPRTQPAEPRAVTPEEPAVTGFVFKVQANMDPKHRDRIAFFRICSGRFERGMKLTHVRSGKTMAVHNPIFFFAQDRGLAEDAYAGDIVGIPNHGTLRVGDALTEGEALRFTGIPNFAPEILRRVRLLDPMRAKHLRRALEDLAEEGVTQMFKPLIGAGWIVGVVGALQLDVLAARIAAEYEVEASFEAAPYETARWVTAADAGEMKRFIDSNQGSMAEDRDDNPVFMARNSWSLTRAMQDWPKITFSATCERS
ncbi:peptide chain release factor 3 [Oceanibacterium hippocampi]|uniref:Peptide chain release factor 3 n=1 Tax=Oceanibacterium hippocampi TaxID=745714 RepID=A0A1Y5R7D7_9PROT|nr:peptide chain release factor 3 [Oceanibacterium hippocampi]SLN10910.1 Peptide chain release factor 3 [Oceanibacterium hippocampi]